MKLPIKLRARRKTRVPTKNNAVHQYRYDWKKAFVIEYHESVQFFHSINGTGKLKTDAQFAKWILDNFGTGTYSIIGWRRGYQGFFPFMKVEIRPTSYLRLKRKKSKTQESLEATRGKIYAIKEQMKYAGEEDQEILNNQLADLNEDYEIDIELKGFDSKKKPTCGQYLKSIKPLYVEHPYDAVDSPEEEQEEEETFNSLW